MSTSSTQALTATAALFSISPLDGRYLAQTEHLRCFFSEFGLMRYRVLVECRYLSHLAHSQQLPELKPFSAQALSYLEHITENFSLDDALKIKAFEQETRHDVKAVEYFVKEKLSEHPELSQVQEFVHFGCTSEDINNLAYALILKESRERFILPLTSELHDKLFSLAVEYADQAMLSRTHGQPASPTTMGKELANVVARLKRPLQQLSELPILGKCNGAVGNFNAQMITYPSVDWLALAGDFVRSLGLEYQAYTTQIEPHDYLAELSHLFMRVNTILIDLSRDLWSYISLGYFKQKIESSAEIGSSAMPHKVNPIDFENAEGNLGVANALLGHFAEKLPISRFQRDLSDSTVLRNIGVALTHCLLAYQSLLKGLRRLDLDTHALAQDLDNHPEVLAEAIQTVMRRYGAEKPYEQLKALTRGRQVSLLELQAFIATLDLPPTAKDQLLALTPGRYTGMAASLTRDLCHLTTR